MKRFFILTMLMAMPIYAVFAQHKESVYDIVKVGDYAPNFNITLKNGKNINLQDLKGKVVLINFFSTWCAPCQKELADIAVNLYPKFKNNENFEMLTIGREHSEEDLEKYNDTKKFEFPLYPDTKRIIYNKYAKQYIPRSYLIGKNGKVIFALNNYKKEHIAELINTIENELKQHQ